MITMVDKYFNEIPIDSILYGKHRDVEGFHFWRFTDAQDGTIDLMACTYGYVHNIEQDDLFDMILLGSFEDHKHLLECD